MSAGLETDRLQERTGPHCSKRNFLVALCERE